jgi:hypothetical protein
MQFGPYLLVVSLNESGVWSLRIPRPTVGAFPADCPHRSHFHVAADLQTCDARSAGFSEFPAYSQILQRPSQNTSARGFWSPVWSTLVSLRARQGAFPGGFVSPPQACPARLTVIVTAAVHWGFGSSREALPLTFQHWAGVSPYTSPYGLAETCVFGKQSPGPAPCGPRQLHERVASPSGALLIPKLRSYFAEFLNEGYPDHLRVLTPAHQCRFAVRAPTVLATRLFLPV